MKKELFREHKWIIMLLIISILQGAIPAIYNTYGVLQLNQDYYVEFEIREIFSILDFNVVDTEKSIIKRVNDKLLLTMQLIDYEDTGCASFMLGDTVIDIETKYHDDFKKLINKYLSLQVADLYLYSVDIF